ncbi:UDP-N-acetylmuramoyl-L-alanyl-D-glutamate--2,6-diaminopimelate ligase [Thermoflavimicrobium dichotomicum]|uniref:UDP-N-acetylmuramoyl-L-alanyl-D-glutamate--2,6-diaminopimelate ligase n=1 Tax=Thermoflavimicrobium dichotomicum TaxID=46223 RepID=A0A1I3SHQ2_9BACL|nr:UDP-N-acetylmuramoyl-L-alanyl-D-glutamate--2,6-diaminopimelate ligase [Thermoflavimicrobium dichotomicum]SFJ58238.1 UDP-N-acetylmuramoyl-L-alanyl-D-glutamate--2,6-diaminopimelate ligase [Thermoflavimicrobium dichotomicum]
MELREILHLTPYKLLQGSLDIEVDDIAFDSRKVTPNTMFVCIPGFKRDGHQFIPQSLEKGATVLVVEKEVSHIPENVTVIKVESSRKALPQLSSIFFGEPTKDVNLIGITGTNGKTSVSFLISKILRTAGRKVGVTGTVCKQVGDKVIPFDTTTPTTPEASDLQRLFKLMLDEGAQDIVMEVSSMALELGRVDACRFKVGVFTNFTQDHLDDHGTMENYKNAKLKLFNRCEANVINLDDPLSAEILEIATGSIITYGINHQEADLTASDIIISAEGVRFTMNYNGDEQCIFLRIPGKFSVYNALAAAGACLNLGITLKEIADGLAAVKGVRGRFESFHTPGGYSVIVDYAHSPDSLENVLTTVREFAKGRIITVFGCGGDRDPSKRPNMGKVAGQLSDCCVLTSDNPRSEDPIKILQDIEVGIKETNCPYKKFVDRKEAIYFAMQSAQPQDVIIIAGKGHENYQEIKGTKIRFDDAEVVKEFLSIGQK